MRAFPRRSSSGRPMIRGTIRPARMPRMTMTTISSIRVKPFALRLIFLMHVSFSSDKLVHLEDRQQDRYDNEPNHGPHHEDHQWFQQGGYEEDIGLHLLLVGFGDPEEHRLQIAALFPHRDHLNGDGG